MFYICFCALVVSCVSEHYCISQTVQRYLSSHLTDESWIVMVYKGWF